METYIFRTGLIAEKSLESYDYNIDRNINIIGWLPEFGKKLKFVNVIFHI